MSKQTQSTPHKLPRQCIFCSNTANSPEHVWSKWMAPHFKRTPHDESEEIWQSIHSRPLRTIHKLNRHGHPTTLKLKVVCRICNNTWMSEVESASKPFIEPMILGNRVRLTEAAQKSIATWVTLKMMVYEQKDWTKAVFIRAQTLAFAIDKTPPANLKIWLCRSRDQYAGVRMTRGFASLFKKAEDAAGKTEIPNTQTVTFGIGQLIIFAAYSHLPGLELGKVRQLFAKRLWPSYRATVIWPPVHTLTGAEVTHLALTLQRYLARPGMRAI